MIEVEPTAGYVYTTEGGKKGFTRGALVAAQRHLNEDMPWAREIDSALSEILAADAGIGAAQALADRGIYLFGASQGAVPERMPEGLLYAQAVLPDALGSKAVALAVWVARKGTQMTRRRTMSTERQEEIRTALESLCLTDVNDSNYDTPWGVPVNRETLITTLHSRHGRDAVPFTYGYWRDLQAISRVDVPEDVRATLIAELKAAHDVE